MKNKGFEKLFFSKTRYFLDAYLTKQRSRSPHTVKAYRDLRNERQWTQKDVAEKLNVTVATLSCYETGRTDPDIETIIELANLYSVLFDYLFGLTDVDKIIVPGSLSKSDKYALKRYIEFLNSKINNNK